MENLESTVQWTDLMSVSLSHKRSSGSYSGFRAMMCREAHNEGITREQIEGALKILPVVGLQGLFPSAEMRI